MASGTQQITAAIREAATALGFGRCGFAPATRPARFESYLEALAAGRHAGMAWLARDDAVHQRSDPTLLLPGARSIVMVATRYATGAEPSGGVARYARGADYHEVLGARLERLAERVRELGGQARPFVDSSAVCEVAHAAAAGLGWIGRNTLLLHPDGGSWWLLGGLLTDLELVPDEPLAERCGTCRRCLDACPTGALVAPYQLDAARCLSYLTIEHKGATPAELRSAQGDWVFGCDICQEVCPWCRPRGEGLVDAELAAPAERPAPSAEWLTLPADQFRARVAGTPLARPKRRGLLRNLGHVLGNREHLSATERAALAAALADEEPLVAESARWAWARQAGESGEE
ncbi:MAG: tRNA epoxyqueuosine(34) reductase QueG [Armatimonadetes bacterium]|nr:tRNA epoxyqueuosine(34) reductase QueG [Armatimonadota bacterium]